MTAPAVLDERRHRYALRVAMWLLAPFVDSWDGLSLNRFLAVLFGLAAIHGRLVHDLPVTVWDVALATLAGALAFGKDVFVDFLNRKQKDAG